MSDTPIFDQLARERNYHRMVADAKRVPAYTGKSTYIQGVWPVAAYVDEVSQVQTDEAVNAALNTVEEPDEVIEFRKPVPLTTLAKLAEGTHQE